MSLSKSKCWYSNNCLHFLKHAVPLNTAVNFFTTSHLDLKDRPGEVRKVETEGKKERWKKGKIRH